MDAEIRQERGAYAVYAGGRHYASCDSYREAQEEIAGMEKAPMSGQAPGAQQTKQLQHTGLQGTMQGKRGGRNEHAGSYGRGGGEDAPHTAGCYFKEAGAWGNPRIQGRQGMENPKVAAGGIHREHGNGGSQGEDGNP